MKLSTELLKEIYNAVDQNLKTKIENEVPEIKPNLEVGKWYKNNEYPNLVYLEKHTKERDLTNEFGTFAIGYGFTFNDFPEWSNELIFANVRNFTLATPEEVETALINEAKKRGFTFGKYFKELQDKGNGGLIEKSGRCGKWFEFKDNKLFVIGYGRWKIFDNGTWATIITEPTKKELLQKQVDELKRQIDLL